MGVVEDVRAALQDFLAPQLRELRVRIDALEEQQKQFRVETEKRFDKIDVRFDKLEDEMNKRFNAVDTHFEKLEDKLADRHEQLVTEIRRTAAIHDLAELEAERRPAH